MYYQSITAAFEIMVFIFFYSEFSTSKKHAPMQFMFMGVGFFMQIVNLDLMRQIAVAAGEIAIADTVGYGYSALIWVTAVVMIYFIGMFAYDTILKLGNTKRGEE